MKSQPKRNGMIPEEREDENWKIRTGGMQACSAVEQPDSLTNDPKPNQESEELPVPEFLFFHYTSFGN